MCPSALEIIERPESRMTSTAEEWDTAWKVVAAGGLLRVVEKRLNSIYIWPYCLPVRCWWVQLWPTQLDEALERRRSGDEWWCWCFESRKIGFKHSRWFTDSLRDLQPQPLAFASGAFSCRHYFHKFQGQPEMYFIFPWTEEIYLFISMVLRTLWCS